MPITLSFKANPDYQPDQEWHSSHVSGAVFFAGKPADSVYTIGRFTRLQNDLLQKNGVAHPHTQGVIIDYAAQHHFLAGLGTLIMLGLMGAACLYYFAEEAYKARLAAVKANATTTSIIKKLQPRQGKEEGDEAEVACQLSVMSEAAAIRYISDEEIKELQGKLDVVLKGSRKHQFARFKNVTVRRKADRGDEAELVFDQPAVNLSVPNVLNSIWIMFCAIAFTYWIGWIMAGTYTGILGWGFAGSGIGLVVPAVVGLVYAGMKVYHWVQHRHEKRTEPTAEEIAAAQDLMNYALEVENGLEKAPFSPKPITISAALRIATAFFIGTVDAFCLTHYMLWYISTVAPVLVSLANPIGIAVFFVAAVVGMKAANAKYTEIVNSPSEKDLQPLTPREEEEYANLQLDIANLRNQLEEDEASREERGIVARAASAAAKRVGTFLNRSDHKAWEYVMAAAFLGRLFTLPLTSPFLPTAFHMIAAAAVLSNTATLLIIFGVGAVWAVFRTLVRESEAKVVQRQTLESAREEYELLKRMINTAEVENAKRTKSLPKVKTTVGDYHPPAFTPVTPVPRPPHNASVVSSPESRGGEGSRSPSPLTS
ncbi:MAG: hypothetical protein K0S27_1168 [Gammaproteobacteria bacterium]|jgi:hypothetical protein|nr:hypothetical protein [Gammaproteobacteria bacterium]